MQIVRRVRGVGIGTSAAVCTGYILTYSCTYTARAVYTYTYLCIPIRIAGSQTATDAAAVKAWERWARILWATARRGPGQYVNWRVLPIRSTGFVAHSSPRRILLPPCERRTASRDMIFGRGRETTNTIGWRWRTRTDIITVEAWEYYSDQRFFFLSVSISCRYVNAYDIYNVYKYLHRVYIHLWVCVCVRDDPFYMCIGIIAIIDTHLIIVSESSKAFLKIYLSYITLNPDFI